MKQKTFVSVSRLSALCFIAIMAFSCKKESAASGNNVPGLSPVQDGKTSREFSTAAGPIDKLVGTYTCSGVRRLFIGNRADSIIAVEVNLADFSPKTMTALNDSTLVCDYADLGGSNWQYIITYDRVKKKVIVAPNSIMASSIEAGSFVTFSATFDRASRTFNFVTGYTNSSGNDRTVYETLVKQ